jgi:hypothetical protein
MTYCHESHDHLGGVFERVLRGVITSLQQVVGWAVGQREDENHTTAFGLEGVQVFFALVSQLDDPLVEEVLVALEGAGIATGLASLAVEGCVLGCLVRSKWLERRESVESDRLEVNLSRVGYCEQ